ncbi:MAG: hypothetical protein ACTH8F_08020 [Microbacterium sp.]|uniref:hypothetical protein n=1 Tax=Microbacterium sp. TaxID=51671 RepID=UPI003F9D6A87
MDEVSLVFRDSDGHKKSMVFDRTSFSKFSTALRTFITKFLSEENSTIYIDRLTTDEMLIVETAVGIIGRVRNDAPDDVTYRRYDRVQDGADIRLRFAGGGYDALDHYGTWTADHDSLLPDDTFENLDLALIVAKRRSEERRKAIAAMPKLDKQALTKFCKVWADVGYNKYVSEVESYYVLFDSQTLDETGTARTELLGLVEKLGLEVTATPANAPSGEVWVRSDPRVDVALEKWA